MLQLGFTEDEGVGTVEELLSGASGNPKTPDTSKVCLSILSCLGGSLTCVSDWSGFGSATVIFNFWNLKIITFEQELASVLLN
jgi:hypothetical protein